MKRTIKHTYYITANGLRINAHWNSFDSLPEASCYFQNQVICIPDVEYSIVMEKKEVVEMLKSLQRKTIQ